MNVRIAFDLPNSRDLHQQLAAFIPLPLRLAALLAPRGAGCDSLVSRLTARLTSDRPTTQLGDGKRPMAAQGAAGEADAVGGAAILLRD
jgi:hypothetical protein